MLIQGNATQIPLGENVIDCVVTDPPYELGFMGKKWDSSGVAFQVETWQEVLRVMKPGAMLFAFGGTRTSHRLICAIEDAGFEIRDKLMWLYGSGFPKSLDISKAIQKEAGVQPTKVEPASGVGFMRPDSKDWNVTKHKLIMPKPEGIAGQWQGQGTALKPAYEDIVLAMKPLDGTFAQNALKWGVAGLCIDDCRIACDHKTDGGCKGTTPLHGGGITNRNPVDHTQGRWPANVILDEEAGEMLDEQSGELGNNARPKQTSTQRKVFDGFTYKPSKIRLPATIPDSGGASRFFYTAKASRAERGEGNTHPTVKPLALIEYLVRLGSRPGHIVLDPFLGSGTTTIACDKLNRTGMGMDLSWEYLSDIAAPRRARPLQRELYANTT